MKNPLVPSWLSEDKDLNALERGIWPNSAVRNDHGELELGGVAAPELVRQRSGLSRQGMPLTFPLEGN